MTPPLKWFGGKQSLAKHIHALAPPHTHRVYVFGGGAGEMWSWPCEGVAEQYNDIDGRLYNFFRVLQDAEMFEDFRRLCEATPYHERMWELACEVGDDADPVRRAWALLVQIRQSFSALGKNFAPPCRRRVRRGMDGGVSAWLSVVDGLPEAHERVKRLYVTCKPAVVLVREAVPETLLYLDPPYLHDTRTGGSEYQHEMTAEDHLVLLSSLQDTRGKFILSGYESPLYDVAAARGGWKRHDIEVPVKTSSTAVGRVCGRRKECLWTNY